MSLNAPLACRLSGGFDWTQSCLRKMGDDLGDEWWTHQGDSGTFIASTFPCFGVTKAAIASWRVYLFLCIKLGGDIPVSLSYASCKLTLASQL